MHRRLVSATVAFSGESNPNFPWEKSHWGNTVVLFSSNDKLKNKCTSDQQHQTIITPLAPTAGYHRRRKSIPPLLRAQSYRRFSLESLEHAKLQLCMFNLLTRILPF